LGLVQEGLRRRVTYTNGKYHDKYLSGLTKVEFEPTDKCYEQRLSILANGEE